MAQAEEPAGLAWIYVESNTGGSSGGHVALRVGDSVYHVQQAPAGLFQIERDDWPVFRHLYAGLQNRTLALAHLDVAAADVERVERRLARAYVGQRVELALRERLALDVAWLEAFERGEAAPPLRGAGLLARGAPDPHALGLRERVAARFGGDFLARESARLGAASADFRPGAGELIELRETLLLGEALRALDEAWPLASEALLAPEGPLAEPLSPAEAAGAARHAEAQAEAVLELLASSRPDRGHPLLLAIARHQALARSAASGRLVLLDAYAGEGRPVRERARPAVYARLADELAAVLREGRPLVLAAPAFDEPRYNLLESGASAWSDLARGAAGGTVRKLPRRGTPAPARALGFAPAPGDGAALARGLAAARDGLARQQQRLASLYPYDVLRRNCVTEIARLVNEAFAPGDVARALGAELEPGAGLSFIPFAFFDSAARRLRVARGEWILSHRERALERLFAAEPGLARRAAESNTLTSSLYTPRLRDGSFLFFTDGVFWRRPLFGLLNLGYATGSGALGLAAAPFDGGRRARAAASGVWYSVPELFFFNIRKGSYEWVPSETRAQE